MISFSLSPVGLPAAQEHQARELLGDGAAALGAPARLHVLHDRAADAYGIDAAVIEEPLILDRNDGIDQVLRYLVEGDLDSLLFEDGEGRPIAGVENRRRLDHVPHVAQRLAVGQSRRQVVREPGEPDGRGQEGDREHHIGGDERPRPARKGARDQGCRAVLEPEECLLDWNQTAMHGDLEPQRERRSRIDCRGWRPNLLIIRRLPPRGQGRWQNQGSGLRAQGSGKTFDAARRSAA